MPIPVRCPNCNAKLNAPDAAAGRRVKCPKCETKVPVPAVSEGSGSAPAIASPTPAAPPPLPPPQAESASPFDFSSSEPPPASPAASPPPPPAASPAFDFGAAAEAGAGKSSRAEARRPARPADDEEEDAEEPPRRGGRRRPPPPPPEGKKSTTPIVLIIVVAAVAFLGCCVGLPLGVYFFLASKVEEVRQNVQQDLDRAARDAGRTTPPLQEAGSDKAPPGWREYAAIDGSFKGYFPYDLQTRFFDPITMKSKGAPLQPTVYKSVADDDSIAVEVGVLRFESALPPASRVEAMRALKSQMIEADKPLPRLENVRSVTWLGQPSTETVYGMTGPDGGKLVLREAIVGNTGYIATIKSKAGRPGPAIENGFFGTFEATAK